MSIRIGKAMGIPSYMKKWVVLSTVLGLLTGIVVATFDYITNLILWSYFSSEFSANI